MNYVIGHESLKHIDYVKAKILQPMIEIPKSGLEAKKCSDEYEHFMQSFVIQKTEEKSQ